MLKLSDIRLTEELDADGLRRLAAGALGIGKDSVKELKILKLSVDARRKPDVRFVYSLAVSVDDEHSVLNKFPVERTSGHAGAKTTPLPNVSPYVPPERYKFPFNGAAIPEKRPVVVGTGPAGLFAALCLAEAGIKCIVLERGQPIERRVEDVERFRRGDGFSSSSNIQFGEGGAGTFSDGKLTTGISDRRTRFVLERLVGFGAPEEILYHAKPHIGTDKLRLVVMALRERLLGLGCDIRFGHAMTDIVLSGNSLKGLTIKVGGATYVISTDRLILAPGNSARDTFEMLLRQGVRLSPKSFSVGVRIEHLQRDIDNAQYGNASASRGDASRGNGSRGDASRGDRSQRGGPRGYVPRNGGPYGDRLRSDGTYKSGLPASDYKLAVHQKNGRSVYTFCVCPGGQVVSSSSEPGGLVTNGMSYYARDGENCNGALVVSVTPEDFGCSPLDGVAFQRRLERAAFTAGGGNYRAPAQLVGDFMKKRASIGHGKITPTYLPGVKYCNLWDVLPNFVCEALSGALAEFSGRIAGFADPGAVLTAVETCSSSPVRIERENYETVGIRGIFPCGEGSGYAGGIMSSAVDGIKCAERVINPRP